MSRPLLAALLLAVPAAPAAVAQPPAGEEARLRGQSDQTYKRLVEAERKLTAGQAADAADDLRRVLDEAGDDLVGPPADRAVRPARQVAQRVLVQLPPAVLRNDRDRTDEPARRLLDAGKAARDPRPLRTLVDRYFVSRPAEEGLLLLGELLFERGEFRAAETAWRRLLPPSPTGNPGADPSYPDPTTDPAAVRARVALAALFAGEPDRARAEVARLTADHPTAAGHLAGRDGVYADTLQALLDPPPRDPAPAAGAGAWTTFGGAADRGGRATGRLPYYWPARPAWTTPIPADQPGDQTVWPRVAPARAVGFHPVVLNGVAYVADPVRVFGFDVKTGAPRFRYDHRPAGGVADADGPVALPLPYDADFTLTAAGDHLIARLGDPRVTALPAEASALVGFAPPARPAPGGPPLAVAWTLHPPVANGAAAVWEGAPLWADGRLYAAFARFDQTRMVHAVACYDDPPAAPVWVTDVADGERPPADAKLVRRRHELLTRAGDAVVFCTHTGVVAAVDGRTGKPAWGFRYPKAARPPRHPGVRDLSPPLAAGGRVFVAPADADRVFALDAATGRQLWESGTLQVEQLLGVARGRLVCTVAEPTRGIRGLNAATGSDREPDGWAVHDDPQLGSFGRGLVSDDLILWPTKSALFLLNPADGTQLRPPLRGPHGNLAFADGVVLVATPTQLWGYVADRVDFPDRAAAAARNPDSPETARRLAHALADAGRWPEADAAIDRAAPAADPPRARAEWLADRAERALDAGDEAAARTLLKQATGDGLPPAWRARAAARLAGLEPAGGGDAARRRFLAATPGAAAVGDDLVLRDAVPPAELRQLIAGHFGVATAPRSRPDGFPPPAPSEPADPVPHRLPTTAAVFHETPFPSPRFVPLLPFAGRAGLPGMTAGDEAARFFVTDGTRVLAYRPGDDRPAWAAPLPPGLAVTHAVDAGPAVIAAGPRGVVALARDDGRLGWTVRVPDADPLPGAGPVPVPRASGVPDPPLDLSDFALAGRQLVARLGDRHLLAVDLTTGAVAWVLDSIGRPRVTPVGSGPCFDPHLSADEAGVIARVSTGERWAVSPAGAVVSRRPASAVEWDGPPVRVGRDLLAVATGPGEVRGVGRPGGSELWVSEAGREASLTGRPPQLRAVPDGLIAAVSRNHGVELDRLRPDAGTRDWAPRPPTLLPTGVVNLADADADDRTVYVPGDGSLFAVGLADGRLLWSAATGPGRWRARAGRAAVLAYPVEAVPVDPPASSLDAFRRGPVAWRLPGLAVGAYDAWASRVVPVLLLDPRTGAVKRRLDLPAAGPAVGVHVGPESAVVVTAGTVYWIR